jgi:Ca-activated chloride channel homolog
MNPTAWFGCPALLALALLPIAVAVWLHRRPHPGVGYPALPFVAPLPRGIRARLWWLPRTLRLCAGLLVAVAAAGPRVETVVETSKRVGADVVLAIDVSRSMLAEDLPPNRLEAAKDVARRIIRSARQHRVGLVAFAARAVSVCPLTTDRSAAVAVTDGLHCFEDDEGTAIGPALVHAIRRQVAGGERSRAVILLTDGSSNRGEPTPLQAGLAAAHLGIRIYTVSLGSSEPAWYPTEYGRLLVRLPADEDTLVALANVTGGRHYNARAAGGTDSIIRDLDQIDNGASVVSRVVEERDTFPVWVVAGLVALLIAEWLAATWLRSPA